jgi:hypothetical protein
LGGRNFDLTHSLFPHFCLLIWIEARKNVKNVAGTHAAQVSEGCLNYLSNLECVCPRWLREQRSEFVGCHSFEFRKIVIVAVSGYPNGHLPERPYAIGVFNVITAADFVTAGAIIDNVLLVTQVPQIGAYHRPKLFVFYGALGRRCWYYVEQNQDETEAEY